jgi:hypothetical protein
MMDSVRVSSLTITVGSFGFFLRLAVTRADRGHLPRFDCFDFFDFWGKKANGINGALIFIKDSGHQAARLGGTPWCRAQPRLPEKNSGRSGGRVPSSSFRSRAGGILPALGPPASRREGSGMTT